MIRRAVTRRQAVAGPRVGPSVDRPQLTAKFDRQTIKLGTCAFGQDWRRDVGHLGERCQERFLVVSGAGVDQFRDGGADGSGECDRGEPDLCRVGASGANGRGEAEWSRRASRQSSSDQRGKRGLARAAQSRFGRERGERPKCKSGGEKCVWLGPEHGEKIRANR